MYNIKELRAALENIQYDWDENIVNLVAGIIDGIDYLQDVGDARDRLDEIIHDTIDGYLVYYSRAWNFLMDYNITDFSEAIDELDAKDLMSIAYYYMEQEVYELLNEIGI